MDSALLKQIEKGTKLKKVKEKNDRSAPAISKDSTSSPDSTKSGNNKANNTVSSGIMNSTNHAMNAGNASQLGGIFAGGFPKLKATGRNLGTSIINQGKEESQSSKAQRAPPPVPPRKMLPASPQKLASTSSNYAASHASGSPKINSSPIVSDINKNKMAVSDTPSTINSAYQSNVHAKEHPFMGVKLKPVQKEASTKESASYREQIPRQVDLKPTSHELLKKGTGIESEKMQSKQSTEDELPHVPPFSNRKKIYPSGNSKGLYEDPNEGQQGLKREKEKLEKELKEAINREDFETCLQIKSKLSTLQIK